MILKLDAESKSKLNAGGSFSKPATIRALERKSAPAYWLAQSPRRRLPRADRCHKRSRPCR